MNSATRLLALAVLLSIGVSHSHADEQPLDYRVRPAGHIDLWPFVQAAEPCPVPIRVSQLQGPALKPRPGEAEVLVLPVDDDNSGDNNENTTTSEKKQPKQNEPQSRDCYQAASLASVSARSGLPAGKLPPNAAAECAAEDAPSVDLRMAGAWAGTEHHWAATCMRHRPLYFEEINAERYGYTPSNCLQPVISAAHFFGTIPALPYKMAVDRPHECVYTLGHYRPGSCNPRRWHHLPWDPKAAAVQTGFVAGMILGIP